MEPLKKQTKKTKKELEIERLKKKGEGGFRIKYGEGVDKFYTENGSVYTNPHEYFLMDVIIDYITKWVKPLFESEEKFTKMKVLDLACGSGEAAVAFQKCGVNDIIGCDPYTYEAFEKRTSLPVLRDTFLDIAKGSMNSSKYDIIVCSYAMHLAPLSVLPQLCQNLAIISEFLLIISPHKRPVMNEGFGWELKESSIEKRVHLRLFKSNLFSTFTKTK